MTEKVGLIKNPLTIIAIFAGIAEVSGTIVLPFIAEKNQVLFIWFLIFFPAVLIISFFLTLNFNNKVLYAPSDYKDEGNYLLSNRYNTVTQTNVLVKEPINEAVESLKITVDELLARMNSNASVIDVEYEEPEPVAEQEVNTSSSGDFSFDDKHLFTYQILDAMPNVDVFIRRMKRLGYRVKTYRSFNDDQGAPNIDNRAIWLGTEIPLSIAKEFILRAKVMYPFLSYIKLFDKDENQQDSTDIFIGGATRSAVGKFSLKPINREGFTKITGASSLEEFHRLIHFYEG